MSGFNKVVSALSGKNKQKQAKKEHDARMKMLGGKMEKIFSEDHVTIYEMADLLRGLVNNYIHNSITNINTLVAQNRELASKLEKDDRK